MKQYSLIITIVITALFIIGYLLYRDVQREQQIGHLISQSQQQGSNTSGQKKQDPYLQNQVKNRIVKGYAELKSCYQAFLKTEPKITDGEIKIDWQVKTSGSVIKPEVVFSPFKSDSFQKCMTGKINEWEFPAPAVQKYVVHKFKFNKKK